MLYFKCFYMIIREDTAIFTERMHKGCLIYIETSKYKSLNFLVEISLPLDFNATKLA